MRSYFLKICAQIFTTSNQKVFWNIDETKYHSVHTSDQSYIFKERNQLGTIEETLGTLINHSKHYITLDKP